MVVQSEPQRYAFNLGRSQDGEAFVYCSLERMLGASLEKSGSHISRPVPISILPAYRPIAIKAPATIARTAISVPIPEKLRLSSGISPVKMSQIPVKSMPRFLFSCMGRLLSANELECLMGLLNKLTSYRI